MGENWIQRGKTWATNPSDCFYCQCIPGGTKYCENAKCSVKCVDYDEGNCCPTCGMYVFYRKVFLGRTAFIFSWPAPIRKLLFLFYFCSIVFLVNPVGRYERCMSAVHFLRTIILKIK